MGFHPAHFELPGPFRSRVTVGRVTRQTDRQTDRHRPSLYNAPSLQRGRGNTVLNAVQETVTSVIMLFTV